MLVDGHARPAALIYPEMSQQLQLAIGAVVSGDKSPEQALDAAVTRRSMPNTAGSARRRPRTAPAST